ncbi:hypothetical protein CVT25_000026, partial [Psilocybe cyanescens]
SKQLYRLEEVPPEEAQYDIRTYLTAELLHFAGREEIEDLVVLTAGLFIYAATVVKYLVTRGRSEQQTFLTTLLASSNSFNLQPLSNGMPFTLLDTLYSQILNEAFREFIPEENRWKDRCSILHTFLCTAERTSTSVIANLLFTSDYTDVAEKLLSDLHAVLYREDGLVLAYHKSFSDFIFAEARSGNFWCDQAKHHRLLAESCFRSMRDGLRFNIADISPSFVLDVDNPRLVDAVKENIPLVLSYSSRNWSYHLSAAASTISDGLHNRISDFLQLRALFWIEAMNLLVSEDNRARIPSGGEVSEPPGDNSSSHGSDEDTDEDSLNDVTPQQQEERTEGERSYSTPDEQEDMATKMDVDVDNVDIPASSRSDTTARNPDDTDMLCATASEGITGLSIANDSNNNAEQQQTNGDPHAASSGFVSPAVQERDFATEVESEVTEGVERSKPKRVPRQVEVDALNGYLCGTIYNACLLSRHLGIEFARLVASPVKDGEGNACEDDVIFPCSDMRLIT